MPARPDTPVARELAWLYSRAAQRAALAALLAIEREIGTSLRPGLDHQVAHARLAWWREECMRCAAGAAAHPLTRELIAACEPLGHTAFADLKGLVDTAAWDLAGATFETRRELEAYCERWSAAMIEPLGRLGGLVAPAESLRTFGRNLRAMELLLALGPDARLGRLRLPLDELARAGAAPEELARAPWSTNLAALLREQHRELRAALAASVTALGGAAQAALRGLLVWAAVTASHSRRAQALLPRALFARDHHAPLDGWRAWRAARRADAGRGLALAD
ncbi:MAG TPA: squalene/phytoene synthase family protein [Steroidobacteraceae bacterium]|nr:squalene/phytoene synthase family protein [Steroidobacteraceae bacterium]